MTTEALRLIDKGLMLDQSLGERAESGFDIMVAYSPYVLSYPTNAHS